MPRPRCRDLPDGSFHAMSHAVDGGVLFRTDADREVYLRLLALVVERFGWQLITYVLMDNHVHLLVIATSDQLSEGLWWLNWQYAEHYKARYNPRFGHVFGGRPKKKPIARDAYFLAVVRYIALNPVPVLCDRPEDHPWSAHRAILGLDPAPPMLDRDHLLAWFTPGDPVGRYERFVTDRDPADHVAIRRWAAQPPPDRPDLATLVADGSDESFREAHLTWDYTLREIARATGLSHATIANRIARGT